MEDMMLKGRYHLKHPSSNSSGDVQSCRYKKSKKKQKSTSGEKSSPIWKAMQMSSPIENETQGIQGKEGGTDEEEDWCTFWLDGRRIEGHRRQCRGVSRTHLNKVWKRHRWGRTPEWRSLGFWTESGRGRRWRRKPEGRRRLCRGVSRTHLNRVWKRMPMRKEAGMKVARVLNRF